MSPRSSAPAATAGTILMLLIAAIAAPAHADVASGGEALMLDARFDRDLMHRLKRKLDIVQPEREVAHTNQPPSAPLQAPAPRGGIDLLPDVDDQVGTIRVTDPIGAPLPLDPGGFITGNPALPGLRGPTAPVLGPVTGVPAWTGLGPEAGDDPPAGSRIAPAVVPAPGAALLLLGAAMTGSRRRRRG